MDVRYFILDNVFHFRYHIYIIIDTSILDITVLRHLIAWKCGVDELIAAMRNQRIYRYFMQLALILGMLTKTRVLDWVTTIID